LRPQLASGALPRYTEAELEEFFTAVRTRIAELDAENARLCAALAQRSQ
jgi:hypothetical protein